MLISNRSPGFTLVELLVAVAVLAIILALGMPNFSYLIANTKIRATAQSIHDGLQLTRAEAIRLNEKVIFTLASDNSWTVVTAAGVPIQAKPAAEGSDVVTVAKTPSGANKVTFNGLGRTTDTGNLTDIDVDAPTNIIPASVSKELRVKIGAGGIIKLCDPNSPNGDPRACQ